MENPDERGWVGANDRERVNRFLVIYLFFSNKRFIFAAINVIGYMAKTEYITVKNASKAVLRRMRQVGVDKAKRLQRIQERWENGDYKDVEIVQL